MNEALAHNIQGKHLEGFVVSKHGGSIVFHKPIILKKNGWYARHGYKTTPCGTLAASYTDKATNYPINYFRACQKCFNAQEKRDIINTSIIKEREEMNKTSCFLVFSHETHTTDLIDANNEDVAAEIFADRHGVTGDLQVVLFKNNRKVERKALVVSKV